MSVIHKYVIGAKKCALLMPCGARILAVHEQHNTVCLWAQVDPEADKEFRHFRVYGTGHEIPDAALTYLGTVFIDGGHLVWHVYEDIL